MAGLVPEVLVIVAAAVIERDGRWLVARRLRGTHLEGLWEFPGGKCEPGETIEACLLRELHEELGVGASVGQEIVVTEHAYPERHVRLHFFSCTIRDEPQPMLGQQLRWVDRNELAALPLPDADRELVRRLVAEPAMRAASTSTREGRDDGVN